MEPKPFKPFGNTLVTATILVTLCIDNGSIKNIINVMDIVVVAKAVTLNFLNKFTDEDKSL